ncbi:MAG: hypothetical protein ACR2JM_07730 [Mycobacterium sp.]
MNVSLRSQMTAGVAALAAVAVVSPIAQPDLLPSAHRMTGAVELSALANPITVIGEVLANVNADVFSQGFVADTTVWPDSFYGVDFLYAPLNVGIIPDLANQFSTGPLVGLVNNLSGYAGAGVQSGIALGGGVAGAVFATPTAIVTAAGQLIAGDPQAALNTLVTEIVGPLQAGITTALAGVGYIVDNVIQNIQTIVTSTIPFMLQGLIDASIGGLTYVAQSAGATATQVVADLSAMQFEAAWNDAVNGFLGPNGTLGQIASLTTGIGIVQDVAGDPTVVAPSVRSVVTSELQRLGGQRAWGDGGITNEPFVTPTAAVTAPAASQKAAAAVDVPADFVALSDLSASEAPAVADAPAVEAPKAAAAAEASTGDNGGAQAASPKKSNHRVGKKADTGPN